MKLAELRGEIDRIDGELVELLCRRLELVKEILHVKEELGAEVEDAEREASVLEAWKERAGSRLDEGFVTDIATRVVSYCRSIQERR